MIQPLADRVVVKVTRFDDVKTKSGLYVPDTAKEKPNVAEVIAVGPGALNDKGERVPMEVSVGDRVIFTKFSGTEVKYAGEEYLVMAEKEILAVINN